MIDAVHDVLLPQTLDGPDNHGLMTILDESDELLRSQHLEALLHFAKGQLNGVRFQVVGNVVDPLEAQSRHLCLCLLARVHAQVIHE